MQQIFLIITLLTISLTVQAYNLTVVATGLKNNKGRVQIAVYDRDGTIPDKKQIISPFRHSNSGGY